MNQTNPSFEATVLPHLDAAYNLARWLVKDEHTAQDMVQEAYLRAFRYFGSFRGEDARPWLLGIVRNTCYSWLQSMKLAGEQIEFNDDVEVENSVESTAGHIENPEAMLVRKAERAEINVAIESLPITFREVLILREIEEMAYGKIAQLMQIPIGTVMSRLSRARAMLRSALESNMRTKACGV